MDIAGRNPVPRRTSLAGRGASRGRGCSGRSRSSPASSGRCSSRTGSRCCTRTARASGGSSSSRRSRRRSSGSLFHSLVAPGLLEDLEDATSADDADCCRRRSTSTGSSRPGFLLLGALLARRGDRRAGGLATRGRWRALPLARRSLFAHGPADVAGDGLLHQLDDPHARPRRLGAGDDARRRRRARPRARASSTSPLVAPDDRRSRSSSPGVAFLVHEQNGWLFSRAAFLHHAARLDAARRRALPARARRSGRARSSSALRLRADVRRDRGPALLPTATSAPIFGHLSRARRGAAPVRRRARRSSLLAALARAGARPSAHATLTAIDARRPGSGSSRRRAAVELRLRPGASRRSRTRSTSTTRDGRLVSRRRRRAVGPRDRRRSRLPRPAARRVHGALAGALGRRPRRLRRLHVRRPRRRARRRPRPTARAGRRRPSTSSAGSTSSRLALLDRRPRLPAARAARRRCRRALERRFYCARAASASSPSLEIGIVAFLLRAEDALQLPFGRFLYGDLSPIAGGTRFGEAFIAMTLGYAVVAALVFLALADRSARAFLWPALALALGSRVGPLAVRALGGRPGLVEVVGARRLGAPRRRRRSGPAGSSRSRSPSGRRRRSCGARAFLRFARLAPVLIALLLAAGIYLSVAAAAARSTTSGRAATARCCS